jgi:hypothetical protein
MDLCHSALFSIRPQPRKMKLSSFWEMTILLVNCWSGFSPHRKNLTERRRQENDSRPSRRCSIRQFGLEAAVSCAEHEGPLWAANDAQRAV